MRAAIWLAPGELEIGRRDDPVPGPADVVVQVGACGLCGTDVHIADGEFPPTPYPIVPGHEFAGEVVAVGGEVGATTPALREGARVAVDPSLFCGHCAYCRAGRGNLCANWGAIGDTVDGAFAEFVRVPAGNAYPLPEALGDREGALVEPVSCAVHALHRLGLRTGERALVIGAGTMGLVLLQLLLRDGASRVAMVDVVEDKLRLAERLGAGPTATSVEALDEPEGFDVVIDATGVVAALEAGADAVRRGGRLMVFGVAPAEATMRLSPFRIYNDEITVLGSMAVLHSFGPALDLMAAGAIDTAAMLSHDFPLDGFGEALGVVRSGGGVKVQVLPQAD
jgi:2-desacetyl-2-hydroxyethyl bacteriochlorophyllide A dehydrogenase